MGALVRRLGHDFSDSSLLERALTHASTTGRDRRPGASNERLEFLGDWVLGLIVAEMLLVAFPGENEGEIARRHAALVRAETLGQVAETIGLGAHLVLAKGEDESGGRENPAILGDCCEAVIAAIHLDGGLDAARLFIEYYWRPILESLEAPPKDAKTSLQEWAQARGMAIPHYAEIGREGPAHQPEFKVEVSLKDSEPAIATGPSKRAAEQAAAEILLARVTGEDE